MRATLFGLTTALGLLSCPALAQEEVDPVSGILAAEGLAGAAAHLEPLAATQADAALALGMVEFLQAIEAATQSQYRHGMPEIPVLPMVRLPLPQNRDPEPFRTDLFAEILHRGIADMARAEATLARIDEAALAADRVSVTVNLSDIWLDVDGDGRRAPYGEEDLLTIANGFLRTPWSPDATFPVRFDAADVAWLRAYTHLLRGLFEVVLALDPTSALEQLRPSWEADRRLGGSPDMMVDSISTVVDVAAAALLTLRTQPDPVRTRAALAHFRQMIAHNRVFWARLAVETDNQLEWIPNGQQTSALGVDVPQEMAQAWQAVLDDADKILTGELLVPYWRYTGFAGREAGLNLARLMQDPPPLDIVMVLQGTGVAPYIEEGPVVSAGSWRSFQRMVRGDTFLLAAWLN